MPGLRLIEVTDGWAIGELETQHVIASVWRGQPNAAALAKRGNELVELTRKYPGKCAMIEVVEPSSKPPSDQDRKIAMEVFRELGTNLACIGFTVEGGEMRSAMTRAIITGMLFFVKQPQPTKVFRAIPDMLAWVKSRMGTDQTSFEPDLAAALEHLRSLIKVPASR